MNKNPSRPKRALAFTLSLAAAAIAPQAIAADAFPAGTYSAGEFSVEFDNAGKVRFRHKDEVLVNGEYAATGDQVRFTDESGSMACLNAGQESGTYRWKQDGAMLSFTKVEDRCDGRAQDLTARAWKGTR